MINNKRTSVIIGSFYAVLVLGIFVFYLVNPFKNKCIKGDCVNGYGIYIKHSGIKYEGQWNKGMKHGKGSSLYPGAYTYDGEWRNDRMHGIGKWVNISSKDPFYYEGEWKNGHRNGKGVFYFYGKKYEGSWSNNLMHGQGTITYPGGYKWIGEWGNDRLLNGKGTIVANNGNRYEGQAKNGRLYGKITIVYVDGSKFAGELISGMKSVTGTIISPDGRINKTTIEKDGTLFDDL